MNAQAAAQVFVETVLGAVLRDALNLAEGYPAAYQAIEQQVREQQAAPTSDFERLENAIRRSVPAQFQSSVEEPLNRLIDAHTAEITIKQQTAYLIGVAVGGTLCGALARNAVQL